MIIGAPKKIETCRPGQNSSRNEATLMYCKTSRYLVLFALCINLAGCIGSKTIQQQKTYKFLEITKSDTTNVLKKAEELMVLLEVETKDYDIRKVHHNYDTSVTFHFCFPSCSLQIKECIWRLQSTSDGKFYHAFTSPWPDFAEYKPRKPVDSDSALISKCRFFKRYTIDFYELESVYEENDKGFLRFVTVSPKEMDKYPMESDSSVVILLDPYLNFVFDKERILGFFAGG